MRVLRIVQLVTSLDIGGMERLALDLALCQQAEGHQPLIYCLTHAGELGDAAAQNGICVHSFEKPRGPQLSTVFKMAMQTKDPAVQAIVARCGYLSARDIGGFRASLSSIRVPFAGMGHCAG